MSSIGSVNGNDDSIAAQTARRAAAGAAEAASNTADGKENVNNYRNSNIKDSESDSVQISTAAQTASDAAASAAEAARKESAEGAEAAKSGKSIADVDLTVVSKGDKVETSEKSAALGSGAKADNKPNVTETQKTETPAPRESLFAKKDKVKATPVPQNEASEKTTTTETKVEKEAMEAYETNNQEQVNAEAQFSALA